MKYLFKGLEIQKRGSYFWPIGADYKERFHEFNLLPHKEQGKFKV